jgi:thiamine pyrophosphate-dependent acetolactate synthase large subunit-like protein
VRVAAAVAEILKREGVEVLIGYPVNPIIEAAAEADIRTLIVRTERTGIHMADAMSRMSSGRTIGVFTMQSGPGTENSFGGVAQAYADSVPILVQAAGHERHLNSVPPNFSALVNYRNITKWIEQVNLPAQVPSAMSRAFTQVRNGRPRPVLVEIPWDVYEEQIAEPTGYLPAPRVRSAPDPAGVRAVAKVLANAERPVIYAGQGVHYAEAWPQLLALAELLAAPVTTSLQGKSAFPETHPLSLGSGGRSVPKSVRYFLDRSDVIFGIGCSFAATGYGVAMPAGKTIIHATLDPADLNLNVHADHALIGDAGFTLDMLLAELRTLVPAPRGRREGVEKQIATVREAWLAEWLPKLTSTDVPMTPYRVIWDLLHTVDVANTIITHDAGSPRDQLSPFWQTSAPLTYNGWGKSTQLGYGLGLAMGAKLVRPKALCINVMGDAAIGMTGMDFETAVRERIPILTVLLNNFSMAIELDVMPVATVKYRSTDISGDYAAMARAFGGYGERVSDPAEIVPAIRRAIARTEAGQPALLEFLTSKEQAFSLHKVEHIAGVTSNT